MKPIILLAEDEPTQRRSTKHVLASRLGLEVIDVGDGKQAVEAIRMDSFKQIALMLIDLDMPVMKGMEAIRIIRAVRPQLPFIVLTGSERIEDAVEAMRLGASDFIVKPPEFERLTVSVRNALDLQSLKTEVVELRRRSQSFYSLADIAATSEGLAGLTATARKAANADLPILITGESGVGKEILARAMHHESPRAEKPFVAINCGALPENLVESILFGHERGAFTGAVTKSLGKCREAEGGTLFLDEIGELKLDMQVKLLRLLQQGEIEPVGSNKTVKVDIRVISATNRTLEELIADGRFREDLYYRLQGFPLYIPSLRARRRDIVPLAEHLLQKIAERENRSHLKLSKDAKAWIKRYDWPGNIRELQHVLARAVLMEESDMLEEASLSGWAQPQIAHNMVVPENIALMTPQGHAKALSQLEREIVGATMKRCKQHVGQAAAALGIGQSTLYKKLRKYQ